MTDPNVKEWTIMFYFASDNSLAPEVVSQLKRLSNAGFHQDVNIIAHFDPHTEGTPTHVFDVNLVNKLIQKSTPSRRRFKFWAENDPFIRNLVFDKLWKESDIDLDGNPIRKRLKRLLKRRNGIDYNPPIPLEIDKDESEQSPLRTLDAFLQFCAVKYKANHYMLFLLGHGLIVGNDMFLLDENATQSSLSLKNLAAVLGHFNETAEANLDLLGLHSCSMSSLEVAYELRDTADYMLASQGTEYVGTWPYREVLIRIFNDVITKQKGKPRPPSIKSSIESIFTYVLRNSYDFQMAGYSFDLCLCDLRQVQNIKTPLRRLTKLLMESLEKRHRLVEEAILLAHWDSQSYWQETYTDLYDFCKCLIRRLRTLNKSRSEVVAITTLMRACQRVIDVLERKSRSKFARSSSKSRREPMVIQTEFAGPQSQYSHGLSVFFPWSKPTNRLFWEEEYPKYKFKETNWDDFLNTYFKETERKAIWIEEDEERRRGPKPRQSVEESLLERITANVFNFQGPLNPGFVVGLGPGKGTPEGGLGPGKGTPEGGLGPGKGTPEVGLGPGKGTPEGGLGPGKGTPEGGLGPGKGTPEGGLGPGKSTPEGGLGKSSPESGLGPGKGTPEGGVGGGCSCPSIKNFPSFARDRDDPKTAAKAASSGLLHRLVKPVPKGRPKKT